MSGFKHCFKCDNNLPFDSFYKNKARKDGLQTYCKNCMAKVNAQSFQDHKPDRIKKNLEYQKTDKSKEYKRNWANNKYQNDEEHRKKCIENVVKRERELLKNNEEFRLVKTLRSRLYKAISQIKAEKSDTTMNLTGCTIKELKNYLEEKFTEGMTWDNHGDWHIDHIKPICAFDLSSEEEQKRCFHFTNLQPLWAEDNLSKGGKYLN